jgi:hypothetical protein
MEALAVSADNSPTPPRPLTLSDSQMDAVMRATAPMQPPDRSAFLNALAHRLRHEQIGDGTVFRACRELQREFFKPPTGVEQHAPKHRVHDRGELR